ncbi:uncharacterized protein PgNI_03083 [Pyricularia grisea]|uniref:Uncharacterized protein n=1 Tax=Pyricularia grisea TaxID=148305 RepID=A0A6P8BBF8_PYRGI|nr:uncharacterized protein PgNI_03083 [Pyricularia grisea]TLD13139.1 hypothetical protein PgNI_03083 [Pyricularia grisea]
MGWALFKEQELRELRDSLHAQLASVNTLLTVAKQASFKTDIVYLHPVKSNTIRLENSSPSTQQKTSILASTATLPSSGTAPEEELSVEPETDSAQIVQMQHAGVDNASWEKKVDLATITVRIEARN